jgi:hypothetical protein
MAEGINIHLPQFEWARKAEAWNQTLCRYGVFSSKDGAELLTPSTEGLIEPFLVDVENSYCYTVPGTTSKANTGMGHYTFWYIRSMKEGTDATNDMFVIVVPYLQQRALYTRTILDAPEFAGIQIATANSFMGWEKPYVFTAAANLGARLVLWLIIIALRSVSRSFGSISVPPSESSTRTQKRFVNRSWCPKRPKMISLLSRGTLRQPVQH